MSTVLITGASGFIGKATTEHLLSKGYNVIGTDSKPSPFIGQPNFNFVSAECYDKGKILPIIEGTPLDAVIHLACSVDNDFPSIIGDKEMNDCRGVDKFIYKSVTSRNIKTLIMLSTTQVYAIPKNREPVRETFDEKPTTNYAKMKAESEKAFISCLKKSETKAVIMRVAPVYTKDYPQNLHDKIYDYKDEVAFLYREGEYAFSFCNLYNLLDFIAGALVQDKNTQYQGIYNVCDTRPISAKEIVEFEREHHHLGAVIQRNYSMDAIKSALPGAGKRPKMDYRYVDLSTITNNINFDNTKATRMCTFRWKLSNTK